jgi:hypothetical protein
MMTENNEKNQYGDLELNNDIELGSPNPGLSGEAVNNERQPAPDLGEDLNSVAPAEASSALKSPEDLAMEEIEEQKRADEAKRLEQEKNGIDKATFDAEMLRVEKEFKEATERLEAAKEALETATEYSFTALKWAVRNEDFKRYGLVGDRGQTLILAIERLMLREKEIPNKFKNEKADLAYKSSLHV